MPDLLKQSHVAPPDVSCGGRPVIAKNSVAPKLYTSLRVSTSPARPATWNLAARLAAPPGGKEYGDTLRVEEFIRQAEQYETGGDAYDTVLKILNTVMRTHPMHTVRAAELLRWHRLHRWNRQAHWNKSLVKQARVAAKRVPWLVAGPL